MKVIAYNNRYEISVDEDKNRIYLAVKGFWANPSAAPNYVEDIEKASTAVSEGFTIVADLTDMVIPPPEVGKVHEKAQVALVNAGLSRTAEVLPEEAVLKMAVDRYAKESQMTKAVFKSREEAEAWLDQQ